MLSWRHPEKLDLCAGNAGQLNLNVRQIKADGAPKEEIEELVKGTRAAFGVDLGPSRYQKNDFDQSKLLVNQMRKV